MEHLRVRYKDRAPMGHVQTLLDSIDASRIVTLELDSSGSWEPIQRFVDHNSFPRLRSIFLPFCCLDTPEKMISLSKKLLKIDSLGVELKIWDLHKIPMMIATISQFVKLIDPTWSRIKRLCLMCEGRTCPAPSILSRLVEPNFRDTCVRALRYGGKDADPWEAWLRTQFPPSINACNVRICGVSIIEAAFLEYHRLMPGIIFDDEPNIYFESFVKLMERFRGEGDYSMRQHLHFYDLLQIISLFNRDAMLLYDYILNTV
eukprot:TRINITY_DN15743_c0_g1_i1.p1 TRINITY_DN15743_c0_g1~~TRINITY_DN15743_c0_g1_i1.p1  ORF type:complete len:296 (+),score=22.30 TRINITY_DN15743_c0_g1_i1:110-889(+)